MNTVTHNLSVTTSKPKFRLTASGLPEISLLNYIQGESLQLSPYQCLSCNQLFKRLSSLNKHNRYFLNVGRCPNSEQLKSLGLQEVSHSANGHDCVVWAVTPSVHISAPKDELLEAMENRAFPNSLKPVSDIAQHYFDKRNKRR